MAPLSPQRLAFGVAFLQGGYYRVPTRLILRNKMNSDRTLNPVHAVGNSEGGTGDVPASMPPQSPAAEAGLLQLVQSHFAGQALLSMVRLGIPDILEGVGNEGNCGSLSALTVDEIIAKLNDKAPITIRREALFRSLRLLCTTGVLQETSKEVSVGVGADANVDPNRENNNDETRNKGKGGVPVTEEHNRRSRNESAFSLTEIGKLLRTSENPDSMAPFVLHWLEEPLWNAWSHLPDYISSNDNDTGGTSMASISDLQPQSDVTPPFDRANGMSASDYYSTHDESRTHRNAVARYASSREIPSILEALSPSTKETTDGSEKNGRHSFVPSLKGKTIVDVGGGYGDLMLEMKERFPDIAQCYCLDLPDVISDATRNCNLTSHAPTSNDHDPSHQSHPEREGVSLVAGDMFDPSTIPTPCDLIFTKHVLCDFDDDNVVRALRSFRSALSSSGRPGGKVVIMDAVLPNGQELNNKWNAAVSFDALLMLTGRRGERSRLEWENLAKEAGFHFDGVVTTSSVTVDLAILSISDDIQH